MQKGTVANGKVLSTLAHWQSKMSSMMNLRKHGARAPATQEMFAPWGDSDWWNDPTMSTGGKETTHQAHLNLVPALCQSLTPCWTQTTFSDGYARTAALGALRKRKCCNRWGRAGGS